MQCWKLGLICLVATTGCPVGAMVVDISPEGMSGARSGDSESGLVYALAAATNELYAVSLNAGLWRSHQGGRWEQVAGAPPQVTAVAVDPRDPLRVAVGQRNGDARQVILDHTGVWDGHVGGGFALVFNPRWDPACRTAANAAVPAVTFDDAGNLFVATACGVYHRAATAGTTAFLTDAATPAIGPITALAVSRTSQRGQRIWARSATTLAYSDDAGARWTVIAIPALVGGYGTSGRSRGDDSTLAALGSTAAMLFVPDQASSREAIAASECNPQHPGENHKATVLYYRADAGDFAVRVFDACDGTGLGGRRFLRSVATPAGAPQLGGQTRIYLGAGQDLAEATSVAGDLTWSFTRMSTAGTHSDFWDIAVAPTGQVSLSNDGGVYDLAPSGQAWQHRNAGMHTHHIHTLTALTTPDQPRLLYSTSDNDSWERDRAPFNQHPITGWTGENACGDTNMTAGDVAMSASAVHWRHSTCGQVTNFTGNRTSIAVMCNAKLDGNGKPFCAGGPSGALQFSFVQTLASESPYLLLDAVALVDLPLSSIAGSTIAAGPGAIGTGSGRAIVRNPQWLNSADSSKSLAGWAVVDPGHPLPDGMSGMIVAGGHAHPTYFGIVTTGSVATLWRNDAPNGWTKLDAGAPIVASGATYGSVFVNPFDPKHIFVIASDGVRVSTDGATFARDDFLTALVTASNKYPIAGDVGSNGNGVILASRANSSAVISQIAFNRQHPHQVLVGAPFTGAYYAADDGRIWRDVGHDMPLGGAQVSSVALDEHGGYVATEGRGVFAVTGLGDARLATRFTRSTSVTGGLAATLTRSDGKPVAGQQVAVVVLGATGPELPVSVATDGSGQVIVPSVVNLSGTTVYLSFAGKDVTAACEATFSY